MQSRIPTKEIAYLTCFAAAWLIFLIVSEMDQGLILQNLNATNSANNPTVLSQKKNAILVENEQVLPTRILIAKIGVDANIENVGLKTDGEVAVPVNPANAGWYSLGPIPGAIGYAVIDGHLGWNHGKPVVFDNLDKLKEGDLISVQDSAGNSHNFVITGSRMYKENDDATSAFTSNDGKAHLNLITCEGFWNKQKGSYSSRLVVFSDLKID